MVELLIGMLIGLVIIGAVLEVMFSSLVFHRTQAGLARLQENARYAIGFVTQDVRLSSFLGCDINATKVNVIANNSNAVPAELNFATTLNGQDNVAANTVYAGLTVNVGTDVLSLKYASTKDICEIETHNSTNSTFSCYGTHPFVKNQPLLVTDCSHRAIFLQSNNDAANSTVNIEHQLMVGPAPKNCVNSLGVGTVCLNPSYQFTSGSILALNSLAYFVAQNNLGQPALYRQQTSIDASGALVTQAREIVEGVENIQFLYGEDSNGDQSVNLYATVDKVDLDKVISLRVEILLRSRDSLVDSPQNYFFAGSDVNSTDNHLRKVVSTTIALRNRL